MTQPSGGPPATARRPSRVEGDGEHRSWAWLVTRVTGLFLAVLVPLHVAVVVLRDDVGATTIITVSRRWADPRWQALEWVTVVLALVHGTLALNAATRRVVRRRGLASALTVAVPVVAVLLGLSTTWTMISFG
jgi:succinate dehydrogenase hydrophobic anchor subunit